jgi:hypothetical protein
MLLSNRIICFWILIIVFLFEFQAYAIDFTWSGTSTAWNNPSNWTSGGVTATSFPGEVTGRTDNVTIGTLGSSNPVLQAGISIGNFTFSNKILDLNTFSITVTGNTTFNSGKIFNGKLIVNSTGTTTFKISGMADLDLKVRVNAPNVLWRDFPGFGIF